MKKIGLAVAAVFCLLALFATPAVVSAATAQEAVCEGVGLVGGGNGCTPAPGQKDLKGMLALGINILSLIVGVAAVIMVILAGFKYITSSGDSARVNSAKDTLLYAVIGIVVASLAQIIVQFVLAKAK